MTLVLTDEGVEVDPMIHSLRMVRALKNAPGYTIDISDFIYQALFGDQALLDAAMSREHKPITRGW